MVPTVVSSNADLVELILENQCSNGEGINIMTQGELLFDVVMRSKTVGVVAVTRTCYRPAQNRSLIV
eukprot:9443601-Heterocapsa_arctica.AAC.1